MYDLSSVLLRCANVNGGGDCGFLVNTSVNSPTALLDACAMGMFCQALSGQSVGGTFVDLFFKVPAAFGSW
jgi:hypothetical protein